MFVTNLIGVLKRRFEVVDDYVNVLEEGVQVNESELAQVLKGYVSDVVVVVHIGGERSVQMSRIKLPLRNVYMLEVFSAILI